MKVKLAYYISELRRDFVKECSRKLQEDDLTPGLLYPVLYIGRHPGCSPKELTEALHMDWGLTQRTLDRLVASHLISREKNPLDRRRFSLNLTKEGSQVFQKSHDIIVSWNEEKLALLTPQEQTCLESALKKMLGNGTV
ncbi:MAG: bilirubin utilization transcriptional regulator BilQ [Marvinbryantia sp.]|uniref:bilirubin utilization transcriptional regulator BilQ n=2 Tax=Marvinbryantia sp. TaxID=2496532 RepID=UPI0025D9BDF0|nr:bilirubin utilization transcriptional regulator BilQ [uncultured Marvinbryantia sp.]